VIPRQAWSHRYLNARLTSWRRPWAHPGYQVPLRSRGRDQQAVSVLDLSGGFSVAAAPGASPRLGVGPRAWMEHVTTHQVIRARVRRMKLCSLKLRVLGWLDPLARWAARHASDSPPSGTRLTAYGHAVDGEVTRSSAFVHPPVRCRELFSGRTGDGSFNAHGEAFELVGERCCSRDQAAASCDDARWTLLGRDADGRRPHEIVISPGCGRTSTATKADLGGRLSPASVERGRATGDVRSRSVRRLGRGA